jgi:hypothetical protein
MVSPTSSASLLCGLDKPTSGHDSARPGARFGRKAAPAGELKRIAFL